MKYNLLIADPAKNITVFVLDPVPAEDRAALVAAILSDPALGAEQAAFAVPPGREGNRCWRLEMMGGEFCGNAARSFGLYVAGKTGLRGRHTVAIESSGASAPIPVRVDTEAGRAEAEIPGPRSVTALDFEGRALPVCVFEGITHVLAPDLRPDRESFFAIKAAFERNSPSLPGAFGVMFAGPPAAPASEDDAMTPAVYVYGTDSLVFESSCGSGSAALAVCKSRPLDDGEARYRIRQPGGVIEVRVLKRAGAVVSVAIGGPVTLGELVWEWAGPAGPA
jgi:diaminopimelate epimerase